MLIFIHQIILNLLNYVSNLMDGGWATGGQKFKRRILDISVYTDPFSFTSSGKLQMHNFVSINIYLDFNSGDLNPANQLSMGTIVTTMIQTVEHYFMQFNTKTRSESRKSPIQVN